MLIGKLRRHYENDELSLSTLSSDPLTQFRDWLLDALGASSGEPNAACLATADANGAPSSRFILLKDVDEDGFHFYTNLESRKARELRENPRASLSFFWEALIRQVTVRGRVEQINKKEAETYFSSRPRESQLSAWASHQDEIVANRGLLEAAYAEADKRYPKEVPMPKYWGGYRLIPEEIEFWQGRPHRLHDRFLYTKSDASSWQICRLSP